MNIRRMLFIVIPALFILNNAVAYFIFESGRTVQQSYNVMLDRVLLYKQIAGQTQGNLRALNVYLMDRTENSRKAYISQRDELNHCGKACLHRDDYSNTDLTVRSYRNMIDTFIGQEAGVIEALNSQGSLAYTAFYEEAEQTAAFIQAEGHHLIDLELSYYQPFYRQILIQTEVMNHWGVAIFILNTLISVLFAYWISLGITRPIKQLALTAQQISDGNLQAPPTTD